MKEEKLDKKRKEKGKKEGFIVRVKLYGKKVKNRL